MNPKPFEGTAAQPKAEAKPGDAKPAAKADEKAAAPQKSAEPARAEKR